MDWARAHLDSPLTVDTLAARSGFGHADTLRHHFTTRRGVTPTTHRHTFRSG